MNPAEWLIRAAKLSPSAPALLFGEEVKADYQEFAKRAAAIGSVFKAKWKVEKGDRVALYLKNSTEYLEIMYGVWFAGGVVVPINAKLHPKEAAWIMENSGAKVAVMMQDTQGKMETHLPDCIENSLIVDHPDFSDLYATSPLQAPEQLDRDDLAWLFYTSGTTGKPKGVMLSAGNIEAMALTYFSDVDNASQEDAILYAAPMSHGAGFYNFIHVIKAGRHIIPPSRGFDPDEILDLAPKLQNVSMFAAPTMVRRLIDCAKTRENPGDGIKSIIYGGGPMYLADIIEAVEVMGPRFIQIFGQGESPMTITVLSRDHVQDRSHPNWKQRLASVGVAQSSVCVRIANKKGVPLKTGEIGEILVRGGPVMLGYWNNKTATTETLKDGWLHTGDMGAMDEDGFVTLHDRSKDVIISGGTNIYPREVEEALLTHPAVHEVSVIGRPDPEWGETIVAFVVLAPNTNISEQQLDQHCLDQIARFKRPKSYYFIDELPKNNYGKILKTELRERLKTEINSDQ